MLKVVVVISVDVYFFKTSLASLWFKSRWNENEIENVVLLMFVVFEGSPLPRVNCLHVFLYHRIENKQVADLVERHNHRL